MRRSKSLKLTYVFLKRGIQAWQTAFAVLGAEETAERGSILMKCCRERLQVLLEGLLRVSKE